MARETTRAKLQPATIEAISISGFAKAELQHKMIRSPISVFSGILTAIIITNLLFCGTATAEVYGDFSGKEINSAYWTASGTLGLFFFSESDSRLHFLSNNGQGQTLTSNKSFTNGRFRVRFHNFHSDNREPSGQGRGSNLALGLGPEDNYVRILRGRIGKSGLYEVNFFRDTLFGKRVFTLFWVSSEDSDGSLELRYDGHTVSVFYYRVGLDTKDDVWHQVGPEIVPGWTSSPHLFITGYPGPDKFCGTTKFDIDSIEYWPLEALPISREKSH